MGKYHARKVEWEGLTFDSKKECERFKELWILQRAGAIHKLERQVRFELIPKQKVDGKVIERAVYYVADFTYYEGDTYVVEDVKGLRTRDYIIKRKLMLFLKGIRVRET